MAKQEKQFHDKLIDDLLQGCKTTEDILGQSGLVKQLTKAILERALEAELTTPLGYEKHDSAGNNSGNSRNGHTTKTLKGDHDELPVTVPRDRNSTFSPQIITKHQTRFEGFDDKILAMYARGLSAREELYGVEVSPTLISNVTNEVLDEVKTWQSRPLDKVYPILYLDALAIKVQQDNRIINKSFYLALAVNMEGRKELLGIWVSQNEGAKFWLGVLTEIKNRGVDDIFITCVDGLNGFPEAIEAVYPNSQIQL